MHESVSQFEQKEQDKNEPIKSKSLCFKNTWSSAMFDQGIYLSWCLFREENT